MHRMFHTPNDSHGKPSRTLCFRMMETLRERQYSSTRNKLGLIDAELAGHGGKKLVLGQLQRESLSSIVEQDESNWASAMQAMERAAGHRKTLSRETRGAAAVIFGGTAFRLGLVVSTAASLVAATVPDVVTGTVIAVCAGAVALASAIKTYIHVSLGEDLFLDILKERLDKRHDELLEERRRLMRKLHSLE